MDTKAVAKTSGISVKLIDAVIDQLGAEPDEVLDTLEDIRNHGIDGGFHGFIYHVDTVKFFERNRAEIVALVERMAEDLGENPAEMVAGFGCMAGHAKPGNHDYHGQMTPQRRKALQEYLPSVSRCLYGGALTEDDTQAANALAWFAAEEVARAFEVAS